MNIFLEKNKIYFAITIWVFIIGGFIYLGLKDNNQNKIINISSVPKVQNNAVNPKNLSQQTQIKADSAVQNSCGASNNTIVTKVIDGDTVIVEGGYHVRLLGIDADEKGYPCYDQAKAGLEFFVLGKKVRLEKDVTDVDQYDRCLRYIFVDDNNIDVRLVKEGLAVARFYQDIKYKPEITQAETYAQQNKIGCKWSGNSQLAK